MVYIYVQANSCVSQSTPEPVAARNTVDYRQVAKYSSGWVFHTFCSVAVLPATSKSHLSLCVGLSNPPSTQAEDAPLASQVDQDALAQSTYA
jgi:hypothetical protein